LDALVSRPAAALSFAGLRAYPLTTWTLVLAVVIVLACGIGAYWIAPGDVVLAMVGSPAQPQHEAVIQVIRLPRVVVGALLGAGLAVAGAMLQGLFRNPLADPGLIGVTSGAALAAAFVIVLGATALPGLSKVLGPFTLPVAAFIGSVLTTWLIHRLATQEGQTSLAVMLLAGIAINALVGAGIGVMSYIATDTQLRTLTFWSLGSLGGVNWTAAAVIAPCIALALALGCWKAPALNLMLLGESEARHSGVEVQALKRWAIVMSALAVGAVVSFCGMVGFIGLVAPHCIRLAYGPDHRVLVPASALLGASLVVLADTVARTAAAPAEMPLGILTALMGAPFFLWLLLKQRRSWGLS
jgi:iron complex transport system permease protein